MPISSISDTARWVAHYRAMETERPDAIFRDPYAERLSGPAGQSIVHELHQGHALAWTIIVRTALFDEIIMDRVTRHRADVVLNLAAGLDARPWRLPLPPSLRWVDVDLPEILEYKTTTLKDERPACRYEAVATDLTNRDERLALISRFGASSERVLAVTEGLLVYLTSEQVAALARDLHEPPSFQWWLIDIIGPRILKIVERKWGRTLREGRAPFQFAPAEGTDFFRVFGWHEAAFRSMIEEARRLHREMRMMWLWSLLGRFSSPEKRAEARRMSGIVLLERNGKASV